MNSCALGIDAGGTNFKSAVVRKDGTVVDGSEAKCFVDTQGDRQTVLNGYISVIRRSLAFAKERNLSVCGIGISTPGPFDYSASASMMAHKMKSIRGVNLERVIRDNCAVGSLPICFLHDSHAFLLGEAFAGAARGFAHSAAVTIGTGTGFAVIRDGVLLDDGSGGPYISIYARPFRGKTVEDFISNRGIVRLYTTLSGRDVSDGFDAREVEIRAVRDDDKAALEAYHTTGKYLAECLHDILLEQSTECFILGGQIAKAFPLMENELRNGLHDLPALRKISRGENLGCSAQIGAAEMIFREGERNNENSDADR